MMAKRIATILLFLGVTSFASAAILLQEDFTPAQDGTLPTTLSASFDPGVDVKVTALSNILPTPVGDHTGGDGYALQVGDLGTGGGGYNWAFPSDASGITAEANCKISAWIYIDWANMDATPQERDYMLMLRLQNGRDPQAVSPTRNAYWFLVTANSSWSGISPNPPNYKAFIMKRVNTTQTKLSAYSTADVATGWHLFSFEAVGSTLKGYIDGALVAEATDTDPNGYTSGNAAFGYYDDNGATTYSAAFDNVVYETVEETDVTDWTLY